VAFKFAVVSRHDEIFETFESAVPNWSVASPVILAGKPRFRVTAKIAIERVSEFIDGRCTECSRSSRFSRAFGRRSCRRTDPRA
jgi:hypothetical protein